VEVCSGETASTIAIAVAVAIAFGFALETSQLLFAFQVASPQRQTHRPLTGVAPRHFKPFDVRAVGLCLQPYVP